jgi:hypothetical protein
MSGKGKKKVPLSRDLLHHTLSLYSDIQLFSPFYRLVKEKIKGIVVFVIRVHDSVVKVILNISKLLLQNIFFKNHHFVEAENSKNRHP